MVGEGVVQAMQKEVRRMELRLAELLRLQERLVQVGRGLVAVGRLWAAAEGAGGGFQVQTRHAPSSLIEAFPVEC
jgi:hypothetical protein